MKPIKFSDKKITEISELLENIKCLMVTATDIETEVFREQLEPIDQTGIIRCFFKNHSFFIGKFGNYLIGHVQCTFMGGISPGASMSTVNVGIELFKPKAVIMVGIAFGVNSKKQKIGDVLISSAIIPYNIQRISKDKIQYRGNIPLSGTILYNRFKNGHSDWEFPIDPDHNALVVFGKVLTGESLIDNPEYRQILIEQFPDAIGGEMESAGLFAAAHDHNVEWIIVKAICDFGDGNKNKNKNNNQKIAASSSTSLCKHVLLIRDVLEELGIASYETRRTRREVFDENWSVHNYKHFIIIDPTIIYDAGRSVVKIDVKIKNIKNDIGTCYLVIKISLNGNRKNLLFNSDVDLDEEEVQTLQLYDIYPEESKAFEKTVSLVNVAADTIQIKIEVWSPARLYHKFSSDGRIALFDKSSWLDVFQATNNKI